MSTTSDLAIALRYAAGAKEALLFRMVLEPADFMKMGIDIEYLSAFPQEREYLYPPLTFLRTVGEPTSIQTLDTKVLIVDVEPSFPT